MLKPQKKKITKKDLKEDKFVETALLAKSYVEENYTKILVGLGVVLVLAVLIMLYLNHRSQRLEQAKTLLGEAQIEYQNMHYNKAKAMLERLIDEYDGTDAAVQGYFVLADLYYDQNKYDEAQKYYKKFIDEYSGSEILLASGYAGYAACLEHGGNHAEAAKYYMKAQKTAPEFVEAPTYLYLAGLNYKDAGMKDKAREAFQKLIEKYKDSPKANDAKAQLILMEKE
jgi:tetratricopeptide (TPR) repeat protein